MKPTLDQNEARVFEKNAANAVRDVGMAWLLRKLVLPVGLILGSVAVVTYHVNGVLAALPVTAVLVFFLVWISRVYLRSFLKDAPFRRQRSTNGVDQ
ncbi:MAG: hypothetical protein V7661_11540 [Sulfitobacter sp.]